MAKICFLLLGKHLRFLLEVKCHLLAQFLIDYTIKRMNLLVEIRFEILSVVFFNET